MQYLTLAVAALLACTCSGKAVSDPQRTSDGRLFGSDGSSGSSSSSPPRQDGNPFTTVIVNDPRDQTNDHRGVRVQGTVLGVRPGGGDFNRFPSSVPGGFPPSSQSGFGTRVVDNPRDFVSQPGIITRPGQSVFVRRPGNVGRPGSSGFGGPPFVNQFDFADQPGIVSQPGIVNQFRPSTQPGLFNINTINPQTLFTTPNSFPNQNGFNNQGNFGTPFLFPNTQSRPLPNQNNSLGTGTFNTGLSFNNRFPNTNPGFFGQTNFPQTTFPQSGIPIGFVAQSPLGFGQQQFIPVFVAQPGTPFTGSNIPLNFGQTQVLPNAFRQPSAFGQPNAFGQRNAFGQPIAFGQPSTFRQPNDLRQPNTFINSNTFRQPNTFIRPNTFQQPNGFQQPTTFRPPNSFQQPSRFGQPVPTPVGFDQPRRPPFTNINTGAPVSTSSPGSSGIIRPGIPTGNQQSTVTAFGKSGSSTIGGPSKPSS